jgi:hypothetical protein
MAAIGVRVRWSTQHAGLRTMFYKHLATRGSTELPAPIAVAAQVRPGDVTIDVAQNEKPDRVPVTVIIEAEASIPDRTMMVIDAAIWKWWHDVQDSVPGADTLAYWDSWLCVIVTRPVRA